MHRAGFSGGAFEMLWEKLTRLLEPDESLVDVADRHRARLMAAVILFVVPVGTFAVFLANVLEGRDLVTTAVELACLVCMGALFPLAKTVHFRRAVLSFLVLGVGLLCFVIVRVPDNALVNASYLMIPLILASAFLGPRAATSIFFLNLALVVSIGLIFPNSKALLTSSVISYQIIVGGILVLAGFYRERLTRESQADLAHREQRHRALLVATFDGTADLRNGRVVQVSGGFARLFGRTPQQLEGYLLQDLFPSDQLESLHALQTTSRGQLLELRALRANGKEFPVEAVFQGLASSDKGSLVFAIRDITERREVFARMQITDRMAAMGTLAAGVAHEINNPLTFASGNIHRAIEHLTRGSTDDGSLLEWLESAAEGADRVGRIVGDLNTFARDPEDDGLGPLEVEKVLDTSVAIALSALRHRANLVREHEPELVVLGDTTRLSQVIVNLLLNAAQAMPEEQAENNEIRLTSFEEDGEAIIEVADNGPGIPSHILPRIFEPFFTTKPVGVGTGLGLSICKNLVERMGGIMEVETSPQGTLFRLRLDVAEADVISSGTVESEPSLEIRTGQRILVVDDEEEIGTLLRDILEDHVVEICCDGAVALQRLEQEEFDVVLCDLMMPNMTGMELFDACVENNAQLEERFIFLTGGAFTKGARQFLERVEQPRLNKPFNQTQIREAVAQILRD